MGKEIRASGRIGDTEFRESISAVKEFREQMDALGVVRYRACGTAGLREAGNRASFLDAAKTVVDCFRYRNKVGLDVALDALRDFTRRRRESPDILWGYARACRVTRVMRPYLEALS